MILRFLRGQDHAVGSNRDGAPAPPAWAFLLPSLEALHPCARGDVSPGVRRGLAAWEEVRALPAGATLPAECRLLLIGAGAGDPGALRDAAADRSVWVDGGADGADAPAAGDARWLLPPDTARRPGAKDGARMAYCLPAPARSGGPVARARRVAGRVLRQLGLGRAAVARSVAYARPSVPGPPPAEPVATHGTLVLPAGTGPGAPAWLERAARDAGHDVAGVPWAFLPSRGYLSQKVLFVLGDAEDPGALAVKVTQHPHYNARLENEAHALEALAAVAGLPPGMAPRARFVSGHRGLSLVGESVLPGVPFPVRSSGRADCAVARRALDALVTLAAASARPASGAEHAAALREVTARLAKAYPRDETIATAVEDALQAVARCGTLPAVFVHGDPGEWNLLVGGDGTVGFLDWENAEAAGPPFFDLISFLFSYTRFALEREGVRPTPASTARRLLEPSPFADLLGERGRELAGRLDVPPALLEPMFVLHAAVGAVREAWRLAPDATARGAAFRWLGEVARRRAPRG